MTRAAHRLVALLGRRPPVDLLLHPVTLGALAVMILNDGWLRGAYPGWVTGKVSDVAAVVAYPGLLAALWGLGAMAVDRALGRLAPGRGLDYSLRPAVILGACGFTGALLVGINLSRPVRDAYLAALARLDVLGRFGPFHYTMDPSDLLALAALPLVWLVGRRLLAAVPTGRLRAALRRALAPAAQGDAETARARVEQCLADARRASGPSGQRAMDALVDRVVEAALDVSRPTTPGDPVSQRNVALAASEHYHRIRKALETHRHRGNRRDP